MQPEDAKEEFAERVEHLDKEVPPESHIGCQVRQKETHTVRRLQELPGASYEGGDVKQQAAEGGQTESTGESEEEGARGFGGLRSSGVVAEDQQGREQEDRVQGEVGGHCEGEEKGHGGALAGFGDGSEDEEVGEGGCRAGDACQDGEGVEEEPR